MGTEKTDDTERARGTTPEPASKPFAVQMMDALADSAATVAKAMITSGVVKIDEAVNKTRQVVKSLEKSARTATKKIEKRTAAKKAIAKKTGTKKSKSAVARKAAAKKTAPEKSATKKVPAKKTTVRKATKKKTPKSKR
jgi:hypothetical protein